MDNWANNEVQLLWEIAEEIKGKFGVSVEFSFANGDLPNSVTEALDAILQVLIAMVSVDPQ